MFSTDKLNEALKGNLGLAIGILVIIAILPYSNIFANQFTFDDFDFFVHWEGVRSLQNIPSFFQGNLPTYHQHVYRPVRSVIQSVVYALSGGLPFGFHIFGLVVQIAGTLIAFLISRKFLDQTIAFVVAATFAVLPIHTDSITFMTASFDTSVAVLALTSFYLYQIYQETKKHWVYILSVALATVSFFGYEIALVIPILIVLYDALIRKQTYRQLIVQWKLYLPYVIGFLVYFAIRAQYVGQTFVGTLQDPIPFIYRMFTMVKAFILYIYLVIINTPLTILYHLDVERSLASPLVIGSLILLTVLVWLTYYLYRKGSRLFTFAILWFFVSLVPVSNIIQLATFVSEHYLYIASFGWALMVGLLFAFAREKLKNTDNAQFVWFGLLVILGIYSFLTFDRNKDWRDSESIYNAAIAIDPEFAGGYNGLAFEYRLRQEYELAEEHAKKALEVNPDYFVSYALLGEIYQEQGRCQEAIEHFNEVINRNPSYVSSYVNRGVCNLQIGREADAEEDFMEALEIFPNYFLPSLNLGIINVNRGLYEQAIPYLTKAVELQQDAQAEYLLGVSLINIGKRDEGVAHLENILRYSPGHEPTLGVLNQVSQ